MSRTTKVPSYRFHKARGCAVVTIDGRNHYLGKFGSPKSREKYAQLIAENVGGTVPSKGNRTGSMTVDELALQYLDYSEEYYRKDGQPTGHVYMVTAALRAVRKAYGSIPAPDFGPLAFRGVQQSLIDDGCSRNYVNCLNGIIKRFFKWAASREIVPVTTYQALATVPGLRKGRTEARETAPILPGR